MTNPPTPLWRTSSYSPSTGGNCVEAGPLTDSSGRIAVRDTKDRTGPTFVSTSDEWAGFITSVKTGAFDQ